MSPDTWSHLSVPSGTTHGGIKRWPARIALGFACLITAGSLPAGAAETSAPKVIVHQDILNNLDWAAAAAARIRGAAGATAALGATVKQPPASPPVSRVLIEPERIARPSLPTRKPTVIAEPPESPAPPQVEAASEAGLESIAPTIETVAETPSTQETATPADVAPEGRLATSESPPAIPVPPEPTEPATAAIDPIVAPSPPDPQPALPETVLLAEAAPEPEPEPPNEAPKAESKPAKESKPGKMQTAALPPAALEAGEFRLLFSEGSVDLTESAKEKLGALAQQLQQQADSGRRIQLQSFASSSATNTSVARRLSLARALAVRTFLIEKGIRSRRIDVRALGAKSDEGPPDRVDILDARS